MKKMEEKYTFFGKKFAKPSISGIYLQKNSDFWQKICKNLKNVGIFAKKLKINLIRRLFRLLYRGRPLK